MKNLVVTEYKDIRVLTTQQIADVYGTNEKVVSNNFNNNKGRYEEGKHYIRLEGEELRVFLQSSNLGMQNQSKIRVLYLWTEKGAFLHAKSLNTNIAWEVYDRLVDSYFKKKDDLLEGISPELRAVLVVDKRVSAVEQKVDHLENTMNIDYAQQKRLKEFVSEVVVNALGGKKARAYYYQDDNGVKIRPRVYSRIWHDFYDYFNINAYANLPRVKFEEALQYINAWQPPTNMQLEIGRINREVA